MVKLFRDSPLPASGHVVHAARGEVASIQIALKLEKGSLVELVNPVELASGPSRLEGRMNFVGFVPVRYSTPDTPREELERGAPGIFPDPILEEKRMRPSSGDTCPIWVSIPIPQDAAPGSYRGRARILADSRTFGCELELIVHKARLPEKRRLWLTNWFWVDRLASSARVELWSEGCWALIDAVARDLASHRQNVILAPLLDLLEFSRDGERLKIDFQRFDRWVELFDKHGVADIVEGSHLGVREGGVWEAESFVLKPITMRRSDGSVAEVIEGARAGSMACRSFLSEFLPLFRGHLLERGWLSRYVQHIADEPTKQNATSWRTLAEHVREFAPGIRRIDANICGELTGAIEIWVPILNHYDEEKLFYALRQREGDEVWFYTCLHPRALYPNRFIDFSLLKTRILHWVNFRFGLTGYLHWGYNWWSENPFSDVEPSQPDTEHLPPGDNAIVYPGRRGVIPSIRWEMLRKGLEDYELLFELARSRPELASEIVTRAVPDLTAYVRRPDEFNALRLKLIEELDLIARD
jgi:hypothetical protein